MNFSSRLILVLVAAVTVPSGSLFAFLVGRISAADRLPALLVFAGVCSLSVFLAVAVGFHLKRKLADNLRSIALLCDRIGSAASRLDITSQRPDGIDGALLAPSGFRQFRRAPRSAHRGS